MNEKAPLSPRDSEPVRTVRDIEHVRHRLFQAADRPETPYDAQSTRLIPVPERPVQQPEARVVPRDSTWEEQRQLNASEIFAVTKNQPIPDWAKLRK